MRWLFLLLALALVSPDALARGGGRSSGGYSLPSGGSRTPSFGGGSYGGSSYSAPSRTPTFGSSGGYGLPSGGGERSSGFGSQGEGDRSYSRQQSGAGLGAYRQQQEQLQRPTAPSYSSAPSYGAPSYGGGYRASPSYGGSYGYTAPVPLAQRPDWLAQRGYAPPAYAFGNQRQFGVWDGLFLGVLLSNLTRPGSSDWFHNHQDDPGYREWRAEADRQAQDNAQLRQQLSQLDQQLAAKRDQPTDPTYLPPDVPAAVAQAPGPVNARTPSTVAANDNAPGDGHAWVWIVLIGGGGAFALLWYLRAQAHAPSGAQVSAIGTAANIVRHKLSGEGYTPEKFRVGMTIMADPTPFILLGQASKVPAPPFSSAVTSVTEVGRMEDGGAHLVRLYLDRRSYVQIHVDAGGDPDECRYFTQIDEVQPADAQEWGVWLDTSQGLIGWPEFQTKDGKMYERVWAPGDSRVPPRSLTEAVAGVGGAKRTLRSQAMLYFAPTGVPAPAPQNEYILVAAVEEGGSAWVEIRAGIDLNPATLQLS